MTLASHTHWVRFAAAAGMALGLIGCGSTAKEASGVKVTNGIEIPESEFPSVVFIVAQTPEGLANCTATFVNDSQAVSAGHCVEGTSERNPAVYLIEQKIVAGRLQLRAVAKAQRWFRDASYDINDGVGPLDVSVINFPADTAPGTSELAVSDPKVDDELTIVGYGNNRNYVDSYGQLSGSGSGKKRKGTNTVGNVTDDGMIQFLGLPEAASEVEAGRYALSGSGDSGGPLFIEGRLAGVTSGGGFGETAEGEQVFISQYVSLRSKTSQALLKKALKAD
ncbi:trypsin-like serine protease [Oligoflexus tunisiensis]|uniref:trypsin-like serine protease n=1 Tax=Oligoflexus tunisiensis TaxID=708132 RepID=UPI00159F1349|nr:trypsin-like serine protease [Oligoflexus tunisiensis]